MARNGGRRGGVYRYQAYRRRRRNGRGLPRWIMAAGLLGAVLALGAGIMAAIGVGVYNSYANELIPPDEAIAKLPRGGAEIRDRDGRLLYEYLDEGYGLRDPIAIDDIALWVPLATISVEDASFMDNPGVNFKGLSRAAWENFWPFSDDAPGLLQGSGGSSITQQLVKNVYFSQDERTNRSIERKIKETVYALELTEQYSKQEIMGWYLNQISYGSIFVGIEAAAGGYFNKSALELSLPEAALLAGIPASPTEYDPISNPDQAVRRRNYVLGRMHNEGYIDDAQLWAAAGTPLELDVTPPTLSAPHFVFNQVEPQLIGLFGEEALKRDGLVVTTTIDLETQRMAENILEGHIQTWEDSTNGRNGSVVVMDPNTAEILGYVGSRDYFREDILGNNDMADALNSPGSSFKPFTYLTAFMNLGWGPGTMLLDTELDGRFWDGDRPPRNPTGSLHGPITIRNALGSSLNIPAVKAILYTGVQEVKDQAKKMGITTLDRDLGPSLTVGGVDVKLVDMVYGYTVFPNLGVLKGVETSVDREPGNRELDPVTILRVEDREGNVLYPLVDGQPAERPPIQEIEVAPAAEAYMITSILSDPQAYCITYGCGGLTIPGRRAGVKTGTSEPYADSTAVGDTWTIGYTPQVVVGTWFGNADNAPMGGGVNSTFVSWHTVRDFLTEYLADEPALEFERPDGLVEAATCIPSNLKPTNACPRTNQTDLLAARSAPQQNDTWWRMARIDTRTGKLASDLTPPQFVREERYLEIPDGLSEFARDQALEWASQLRASSEDDVPTEETTEEDLPLDIAVTSPANGAVVRGVIAITGRAASPEFEQFRLEYLAEGGSWQVLTIENIPVDDGLLGVWDTNGLDPGPYTLRLTVVDRERGDATVSVSVQVQSLGSPPDDDEEGGEEGGRRVGPRDGLLASTSARLTRVRSR